jgi:hypothetical protein
VSLLPGHQQDTVPGTEIPIYAPILIQGALILSEQPELGFLLKAATTVILTLSKSNDPEACLAKSRLHGCVPEFKKLPMTAKVKEINGDRFVFMTVTKDDPGLQPDNFLK